MRYFRGRIIPDPPALYMLTFSEREEVKKALSSGKLDKETENIYKNMLYMEVSPRHTEEEQKIINKFYALKISDHIKEIEKDIESRR